MNVVIAQSDLVTAYGWGVDALWNGLLSGKTAVQTSARFATRGFSSNQMAIVPNLDVRAGESRSMAMLRRLLSPLIGKLDPNTPLLLATTVGEIEYIEQAVFNNQPDLSAQARPDVLLGRIKQMLGLAGPSMVVSSACASSAAALTRAASMIRRGDAPSVLVVSVDAISEFVYSGFSTLLSLCETPARPFDADRSGLSLGESAAWALVKSDESDAASSSVAIVGWGSATDAVHMTAPDRNAGGLSRAIAKACTMAGRKAADIAFIAAHGTATVYNDAMELVAFRETIQNPIPVFSVKGGIGHTLATAGMIQVIIAARAMALGVVPPTVGLAIPDPAAQGWVHNVPIEFASVNLAMSTNSGFGGVNTAILLGRYGDKSGSVNVGRALPAETLLSEEPWQNALAGSRGLREFAPSPGTPGEGWGEGPYRNPPQSPHPNPLPEYRERGQDLRAVAWYCAETCGSIRAGGAQCKEPTPSMSDSKEILALVERPVKYLSRMGAEARSCLMAASLAMRAAGWVENSGREIALLAAGYEGWLSADEAYFKDYVASGLTLGRGNLFIYTLPTSTQGELSIALGLTGPTLHIQDDSHPVRSLLQQARQLLDQREANAALVLWSDAEASVCFAISGTGGNVDVFQGSDKAASDFPWDCRPLVMARSLAAHVVGAKST